MGLTTLEKPARIIYSDVNPDVLLDSQYELLFNADAVKKSLEAIFTTPYASRVFRRDFGTKVLDLLYEPVDSSTASLIETLIRDMATTWESRITALTVLVLPDTVGQRYYVDMRYSIVGLGDKMVNYKFNISK